MFFRDGVDELFRILKDHDIPLLILSAGVGGKHARYFLHDYLAFMLLSVTFHDYFLRTHALKFNWLIQAAVNIR